MVPAPLRGQKEAQRRSAPKGGGETAEPEAEETRGDSRTQESLVSDGQRVSEQEKATAKEAPVASYKGSSRSNKS